MRAGVSPDHVSLLILELPRDDYDHVALSYPDPLLHLSRYAGHPGYAVNAPDLDAIGAKQAFYMTEYLSILFAGETDPGNDCAFFLPTTTSIIQLITSNNNKGLITSDYSSILMRSP